MDTIHQSPYTPQFRVLSDGQISKIYQATLECLYRTGVEVLNEEARTLLEKAGAFVDGVRVRIPPHIIQDALASSPRSFTLWGQDRKSRMQIVPDRVYFGPGPSCTHFIDPYTGERRLTYRGDPGMTARVCDALKNIDYVMSLGLISDVPPTLAPIYEFAEMVVNTRKPILTWAFSTENISDVYQMALAVAGSERTLSQYPFIALFSTYQSPLRQTNEDIANVMWAAERHVPVIFIGGGCAGVTAPISSAGLLVIYLAGALSGLAIIQLKKRGAPVCIGGVAQPMDLRNARPAYGAPETSLHSAAMSDISRYLGVPFMGTAGASEAKVLDVQAAIESTAQVVLSGLSGATLVHDVGMMDCADTGSLEMVVMTDEIIGMTRRILRGIEVTDDTLMLDLIDEIGPGGAFMTELTTAKRCRSEIWNPTMMDREPFSIWEANGAFTMQDRVKSKLKKILEEHQPPPIPDGAAERIEEILQAAEKRLAEANRR